MLSGQTDHIRLSRLTPMITWRLEGGSLPFPSVNEHVTEDITDITDMTDLFLAAQSSNHLSTIYIIPSNPALGWEYILYTHNFYPLPNQNNNNGRWCCCWWRLWCSPYSKPGSWLSRSFQERPSTWFGLFRLSWWCPLWLQPGMLNHYSIAGHLPILYITGGFWSSPSHVQLSWAIYRYCKLRHLLSFCIF